MSARNDGGPAFPVSPNKTDPVWAAARDGGMTLRDYFAAKAMAAALADEEAFERVAELIDLEPNQDAARLLANFSYQMADAMLAARGAA